jgi:hypothetical protein
MLLLTRWSIARKRLIRGMPELHDDQAAPDSLFAPVSIEADCFGFLSSFFVYPIINGSVQLLNDSNTSIQRLIFRSYSFIALIRFGGAATRRSISVSIASDSALSIRSGKDCITSMRIMGIVPSCDECCVTRAVSTSSVTTPVIGVHWSLTPKVVMSLILDPRMDVLQFAFSVYSFNIAIYSN